MSLTSLPRQFYVNTPSETNEQWAIDAWLFPPDSIHRVVPVLFCQPGGGYDKSYWHLEVPGCAPEAYSFARFMAKQGCLVVAIDHLGTGQSSKPEAGRLLTAEHIAAANAEVVEQVRQALLDGTLLPDLLPRRPEQMRFFVVGHSMGAFLALYLWHLVDAMALLGWTSRAEIGLQGSAAQAGAALGQTLPADATLNTLATFIPPELDYLPSLKALLHPLFYLDDVPEAVIQADEARGTHLPTGIMKTLCNVSYQLAF